jgi:hypothetical protein
LSSRKAYTDVPGDKLKIDDAVLENAKVNKRHYFEIGDKI